MARRGLAQRIGPIRNSILLSAKIDFCSSREREPEIEKKRLQFLEKQKSESKNAKLNI